MKFSGSVKTFSRRVFLKNLGGRGRGEIFSGGIENFSRGVGIFRERVEI